MVVKRSISVHNSSFSPLHWTAMSWFAGIVIALPFLPKLSAHLDRGHHQPFTLGAATALAAFVCLLTGFFKTTRLFPFYIAIVTVSITFASSVHSRHLGLLARGLASSSSTTTTSRLSLFSTAFGSFATAVIALFTFHMLRRSDHLTSLWVVSIFCGLELFVGVAETFLHYSVISLAPPQQASNLHWPQLLGRLSGVFLSSFSSTCLFTAATLYAAGSLCIRPVLFLALWMVYFLFGAVGLPAFHPLQLLIRADPVKMSLLGFILSAVASGLGFYFKEEVWHWVPILAVTIVQSAGAGILHAFGRVMVLELSPKGKEGVFACWYEWVKMSGACAGFALAAASPQDIRKTFGGSFVAVFVGVVVLIFGSDVRAVIGGDDDNDQEGGDSAEINGNGLEKSTGDESREGVKKGEGSALQV